MGRNIEPPQDIISHFKRLEKRIENLERSQRISNTSIDQGSIVVNNGAIVSKHPNGVELFRAGVGETVLPFEVDPTQGYLTRIKRGNGQVVFEVFTDNDGAESRLVMNDRNGNQIFAEDWLVGKGLARPYIPWGANKTVDLTTPPDITTSGTFVAVYTVQGILQHPALFVRLKVVADAGTTGEIRLQDTFFSSTLWSDTIASGSSIKSGVGTLNGLYSYGQMVGLEIQVRRTSGAGNIRTALVNTYGQLALTL